MLWIVFKYEACDLKGFKLLQSPHIEELDVFLDDSWQIMGVEHA